MKYVLVLQWPASSISDFDALIELEDRVVRAVGPAATVDGHDFGSGEVNIFVFTDDPRTTFAAAAAVLGQDSRGSDVRAAFRHRSGETYTVLWPLGHEFSIA
ncbi:hypothetical protein [Sinomonas sp.]|uniref:hypothetical protein n=1 Tax=Sinomonas sp. TaxID=1914986 RepID=UPI002FE0DFE3